MAIGLNVIVGAITAALIYRLALRYCNRITAVVAAWAWAIAPFPAIVIVRPWDTAISGAVLCAWLSYIGQTPTSIRHSLALGALAGVGCLFNPALMAIQAREP